MAPLLTKDDCEKILHQTLPSPAHLISYKISKYHENTAGLLGDHLNLTIRFATQNVPQKNTYFIKAPPQSNPNQLDYVMESGIFNKEVLLYKNLLNELLKISHFGPRCYYIKNNLMVLEDLTTKGYKMLPKLDYLSPANCSAMLKNLARFHASTIVYEKKWGVKLDQKLNKEIEETCFSFIKGTKRHEWLVSSFDCITELMKLVPGADQELVPKFQKFVFEEMPTLISPSKRFRNVLTHDDLWCNNMLFNREECLFVDFQLARYMPPTLDLLTALYLNLDVWYVENNLGALLGRYHQFLVQELERNGLDKSELPYTDLEEAVEPYKMVALVESAMYGTQIFISDELSNEIISNVAKYNDFTFVKRSKYAVEEFQKTARYRERLSGLLSLLFGVLERAT